MKAILGLLLSVFCLTLLLNGCKDDETSTLNENSIDASLDNQPIDYKGATLERISLEEEEVVNDFLQKKISGKYSSNTSSSRIELPFGTVNLEDVMVVTDSLGNVNYSLKVKSNKLILDTFYNLVIHQNTNSGELYSYILEYKMSQDFKEAYYSGTEILRNFRGTVSKYEADSFYAGNFSTSVSRGCEEGQGSPDAPCSEDPIDLGPGGTGDEGPGNPGGGDSGDGAVGGNPSGAPDPPRVDCDSATIVLCCDNGFCDSHSPRRKWRNGPFCSGSRSVDVSTCSESNKMITTSRGDCSPSSGSIGINMDDVIESGIPLDVMDFLAQDCPRYELFSIMLSSENASELPGAKTFMTNAVRMMIQKPDNIALVELTANLISARNTHNLSWEFLDFNLDFVKNNNYSTSAFFASNMTIWAEQNNKYNAEFSQEYLDQLNCCGWLNELHDVSELLLEQGKNYMTNMWVKAAILKRDNPNWSKEQVYIEANLEAIQIGLDIVGLIPVVGEGADFINGAIYLIKGDATNATLSFAATVPFAGWAATGTKFAIKIVDNASTGQKIVKVVAEGSDEVAALAAKVASFKNAATNTINSLKSGARYSLDGTGAFRQVNGHHPLAKKAFEGVETYNKRSAFSVSSSKLQDVWRAANPNADLINVHNKITGKQISSYSNWKNLNPNKRMSLSDMANIEIQAMTQVGIPDDIARGWVIKTLEDLISQGVTEIKRIPWNGINPN